jgi:hypothetical protein
MPSWVVMAAKRLHLGGDARFKSGKALFVQNILDENDSVSFQSRKSLNVLRIARLLDRKVLVMLLDCFVEFAPLGRLHGNMREIASRTLTATTISP